MLRSPFAPEDAPRLPAPAAPPPPASPEDDPRQMSLLDWQPQPLRPPRPTVDMEQIDLFPGRRVAVGVAVEDQDVRAMQQPVQGGAGQQRVAEQGWQFIDGAVGGQQGGGPLVALADDLVEVDGLIAAQGPQAEVIDDE